MRLDRPWRVAFLTSVFAACGIAVGCTSFGGDAATATTAADAGSDGPALVDAIAAPRFCKTGDAATALFCADFDDGLPTAGWQLPVIAGGTLTTTPSERSAPNALLATITRFDPLPDASASAGYGAALLSTSVGRGVAGGASLELDLRIDELPTTDGGTAGGLLAAMAFDINTQSVNLGFQGGALYFVMQDPSLAGGRALFPVKPPAAGSWFHVRMVARFDGSGADLFFNGIPVANAPKGMGSAAVGLILDVGATASATGGQARVAYDNVTLTLH
jgi:hypothetical protein